MHKRKEGMPEVATTETVLGERTSEEFPKEVARRIMAEARLDPEQEDSEYAEQHREAAGALGDYVLSLSADDPRFLALSRLQLDDRGNPMRLVHLGREV